MVKKSESGGNKLLVPALLIAVIVLGGMWYLSSEPSSKDLTTGAVEQTGAGTGGEAGAAGTGGTGGAVAPAPATGALNSGELELFLKDMRGNNGGTSYVLLLDPKVHALDADGAKVADSKKPVDLSKTRYNIMQIHYNKGLDGLTSINGGTPKAISAASGEWSETQLTGKIGDQVLVYTYVDTTPAAGENASTVDLMTLSDFYRETGKWVAQDAQSKTAWDLYNYATYDWYDGTDTNVNNYTIADSGTAASNQVVTWYSRASQQGEYCVDCSIYLKMPTNYSSKFKSLVVTDKFGHSAKYAVQGKAENFAGYKSLAATILATASDPYSWYYMGDIPADMVTLYTAGDKNRLTWELTTDTYGSNMTITFNMVQNAKAEISNNGPFTIADDMPIKFSNGATSEFNDPGTAIS